MRGRSKKLCQSSNSHFTLLAPLWAELVTLGGTFSLPNCEFAFRFKDGEIFSRYLYFDKKEDHQYAEKIDDRYRIPYSFATTEDFLDFLLTRLPSSVEIGRIFLSLNRRPQIINSNMMLLSKPLVFDVDISDYERERGNNCFCQGDKYKVCDLCWKNFMRPALVELTGKIPQLFGFKSVFAVFSGRRGFHVWIVDETVWRYTPAQREAICARIESKIDTKVTTQFDHLVKLPLVLHPKTQKFAIPIDEEFLPSYYKHPDKQQLSNYVDFINLKIKNGRDKL